VVELQEREGMDSLSHGMSFGHASGSIDGFLHGSKVFSRAVKWPEAAPWLMECQRSPLSGALS
jgi:hypothetical protein